jgi:glycosyltransferase involved in cell wall biosynthesis
MFFPALIAGGVCVAAWAYLLLGHGRFWRIESAKFVPAHSPQQRMSGAPAPTIAIVIPARNEQDVIGTAIASLLHRDQHDTRIFVVDDNSTDGTVEAARVAAAGAPSFSAGAPPFSPSVGERVGVSNRVTLISGRPLPPGWSGKLWAMQQGIEQALLLNPDFLLLTDADVDHAPHNVAALVRVAESGGYDLVSFMVKLHCRSFAEKVLIPPPLQCSSPASSELFAPRLPLLEDLWFWDR